MQTLLVVFVLLGCGSDGQQILKSFTFNVGNNVLSFDLQFNQNVELNTAFTIPILNYGSVTLTPPADGNGFIIGGTLNLNYIYDGDLVRLSKTRLLPNGQRMPTYVTQDVAQIRIKEADMIYSDIYLGLDLDHMYLGTALELGYIDQNFPAGLVISVWIKDKQNRTLGVISIFGPHVENGKMISPGGFAFMTNVSDLIKYYPNGGRVLPKAIEDMSTFKSLVQVNQQYKREYSDPLKLNHLIQQMRKSGQDAGYVK